MPVLFAFASMVMMCAMPPSRYKGVSGWVKSMCRKMFRKGLNSHQEVPVSPEFDWHDQRGTGYCSPPRGC